MANYKHTKRYKNHYGLDLKATDLNRLPGFASEILNAQYAKSGEIVKRPGYQAHGANSVGYGLFTYERRNPSTGAAAPEVVGVGQGASKLLFTTLTVNYTGSDDTAIFNLFYDPDTEVYRCQILVGDTNVLDMDLGLGFDEASPVDIDDLRDAINLIPDFTASVTGDDTVPAAFLKIVRDFDLTQGDASSDAAYWSAINTTVSNPFNTYYGTRNADDFEITAGVVISNVLYISAGGKDYVHKYDGQTLYRAGLPSFPSLIAAVTATAGLPNGTYIWQGRYAQKDAAGNTVEGNLLSTVVGTAAASFKVDLQVNNIQAGSGFNTNCGIVAGAQVTVNTITVDDGSGGLHTLKVGDTAYFFDAVSASYVERAITAKSNTTITIAGAAVTVADNAVISNNLRIQLFRNKTLGTVFYELVELPNNSFAATQNYLDNTADSALSNQLIEPVTDRSAPPLMKYISAFQNQMVGGGGDSMANDIAWSDVDGPEYFPSDSNSQNLETIAGDTIQGMSPCNEVFAIGKGESMCIMSGTIADNKLRFDWLAGSIGVIAHNTMKDVEGHLCWMSDRGPYTMVAGQLPKPLGENEDGGGRLEPICDQGSLSDDQKLIFKRAIAVNHRDAQKYVIFFPAESESGGNKYTNGNSLLYVWDYAAGFDTGAWLRWSNMDFSSGAVIFGDEFYFQERRYSDFASAVHHVLYRRHTLIDAWSYEDNNQVIEWTYSGNWEALGESGVFKKYLRIRVYQAGDTPNNAATLNIVTESNYIRDTSYADFDVESNGDGYGSGDYGNAPYGNPSEPFFTNKLSGGRFYSQRVKFSNSEHQANCHITAWEVEIAAPFKPELKK